MGCLTALSHFVSWLGECGLPLYKLLKKADSFHWTEEMQNALDELKALITKLSVLASPEPSKSLRLYLAATTQVVSTALVVEREEPRHVYKVQRSIYYISKVLSNCETHYNQVKKLLYAVLIINISPCIILRVTRSVLLPPMGSGKLLETASPWEGLPSGHLSSWRSSPKPWWTSWRNGPKHNSHPPQLPRNTRAYISMRLRGRH
jgi:hypothetical protein